MDQSVPKLAIANWVWGQYLGDEAIRTGIHVMVSSYTRFHPNINMSKSKVTGNYANTMMVKTLALRAGFDEAVILDPNGFVAECTGESLFMLRDGVFYTPPREAILERITRDTDMKLAAGLGLPVVEGTITRDQLYIADEVLLLERRLKLWACG